MSKTALMLLVMLALFAIVIYGQGQTDQSTASDTTTTTTTTGSPAVSTTVTMTATGMTLYEASPSIQVENVVPIGKAHIAITKQSDDLDGSIYKILIEDANQEPPLFVPNDIVVTFSVDNNVYIEYNDVKIQYKTITGNYVPYNPNPCNTKFVDIIKSVVGVAPSIGTLCGVYDIFNSAEDYYGKCLSPTYDWYANLLADGNKVNKAEELQNKKIEKNIIGRIMGATEEERNNRHVETLVYSEDPISDAIIPPRSIVITIPVKPKDISVNGDIRMWIDIRGHLSLSKDIPKLNEPETAIANSVVGSVIPSSLAVYFENKNMFQKESPKSTEQPAKGKEVVPSDQAMFQKEPPTSTEEPTGTHVWYTNPQYGIQRAVNEDEVRSGDIIHLAPGTYNENIVIDKSLVLEGVGAGSDPNEDTIVTGQGLSGSVFTIGKDNSAIQVNISKMKITEGNGTPLYAFGQNGGVEGGGILNFANATIKDCLISKNSAGSGVGITNCGTATITGCTFSGNPATYGGGGILNFGTATVTGCILSGNSATIGGAIDNSGNGAKLTVSNSEIYENSATYKVGGIINSGMLIIRTDNHIYQNIGGGVGGDGTLIFQDQLGNTVTDSGVINSIVYDND